MRPSHETLVNQLYDQVRHNFEVAFGGIISGPDHLDQMTRDSLNPARSFEQLAMLERCTGEPLQGKRILEVGAGHGLTVTVARVEFGAEAYGIEPSNAEFAGALRISQQVLEMAGIPAEAIRPGVGEALSFPDEWFDCVFSSNVLEHVQDPQQVIDESLRVLKPRGYLHIVVPNYGSWWEGHYGILWLPNLPRWLAKVYVRLMGRQPAFLDTLQFINHARLQRLLTPHLDRIEVIGWGFDIWKERVQTLGFSEWSSLGKLKRIVVWLHRLGLVRLVIALGRLLHWETPIILTVRKLK